MRIGLVTCRQQTEPDPDAKPLEGALRRRGHSVFPVAWDDDEGPSDGLDLLVIRSSWNYHERPDDFLRWIEQTAQSVPVLNTPEIVRWNIHKGYLLELASAGVATVPTHQFRRGCFRRSEARGLVLNFGGVVIKPAIGAGSVNVRQYAAEEGEGALAWLEELSSRCDVLLQPYMDGFRDPGERSLIWIDGAWTHAIRKQPRFAGQDERVDASAPPTPEEIRLADAALNAAPGGCLYARADLVRGLDGRPLLSELELIEPSLYFDHCENALQRFVAMLERARSIRA